MDDLYDQHGCACHVSLRPRPLASNSFNAEFRPSFASAAVIIMVCDASIVSYIALTAASSTCYPQRSCSQECTPLWERVRHQFFSSHLRDPDSPQSTRSQCSPSNAIDPSPKRPLID